MEVLLVQNKVILINGFNVDGRRKMSGSHSVYYDTHYGYYGDSSAYPQIELPPSTHDIFWKCFDEYFNEYQDQIIFKEEVND